MSTKTEGKDSVSGKRLQSICLLITVNRATSLRKSTTGFSISLSGVCSLKNSKLHECMQLSGTTLNPKPPII